MKCIITTEGFGDMVFELYPGLAPVTVKNFVDTVNSGFYNGLAWCRIVKDYVCLLYTSRLLPDLCRDEHP